jgi:hypothetical protein
MGKSPQTEIMHTVETVAALPSPKALLHCTMALIIGGFVTLSTIILCTAQNNFYPFKTII